MRYDKQLIHCDPDERVLEIESLVLEDGFVVSIKTVRSGDLQPFAQMRRQLESEGWLIEPAGVIPFGKERLSANSYAAIRPVRQQA